MCDSVITWQWVPAVRVEEDQRLERNGWGARVHVWGHVERQVPTVEVMSVEVDQETDGQSI